MPVLPAGEVDLKSAGSWNSKSNSKPWDTQNNNDWMQEALNPNMDFQQFQDFKNKAKKNQFNLEDYENMKESMKTGDFLKQRPEIKMSLDDMLSEMFNRLEAEHKMKEDHDTEVSDTNLYALHKLAKLNADFLENQRQKEMMEKMEKITAPEITASDFYTPNRSQKRQQNKFRPSQEHTYQPYEDPADDIYPTRHTIRHKENNDYQRHPIHETSEFIRHPIAKPKQKQENKNKFNFMKNENLDEPISYSHNKWMPVVHQKPKNENQNSYRNWGGSGAGSNRFSTHDSTSTDDNDMEEIMNFSSFDNSFNENKSNIPKINKNKKRNPRPQSSVYVAKVYH